METEYPIGGQMGTICLLRELSIHPKQFTRACFCLSGGIIFSPKLSEDKDPGANNIVDIMRTSKNLPKRGNIGQVSSRHPKVRRIVMTMACVPRQNFSILPNLYFCNFVFLGQSLTCVPRQAKQSLSNSDIPFTFVLLSASTSRSIHDLKNKQILFVFAKMKYVNTNFQANHFSYLF